MPELPEVETVRSQIESQLPVKIVKEFRSENIHSLLRKGITPEEFSTKGLSLSQARRHGKVLLLDFYNEAQTLVGTLWNGFGMSGGWRIGDEKVQEKHTHLQWKALNSHGKEIYLAYVDPRRFGSLSFMSAQKSNIKLLELGVDVGSESFSSDYLFSIFKKHGQRQLKPFLLEQRYFAGIGNYIACEICAHAGLRPTRRLKTLSKKDCERIIDGTKKVLQGTGSQGGMTFSGGYKDTTGSDGGGLNHLVVFYQEICKLCHKTPVKKIVMATRGTYYCPHCQS